MADAVWAGVVGSDDFNGSLGNDDNYAGESKASEGDNLIFNGDANHPVTAGLDTYAALDMGDFINNMFPARIGAADEFLEALSFDAIKFRGLNDAYLQGDCPAVYCYSTGAGALHLQCDGSADPVQDFDLIIVTGGTVFIDNGAANATKIKEIHVSRGAEVIIAEGVTWLSGAAIYFHDGGTVRNKAGGDVAIYGRGGLYILEDDAGLSHTGQRVMPVTVDHRSSGTIDDMDFVGGARLITTNNHKGGTAGALRFFPGATHDLDAPGSGVAPSSVTVLPPSIGD